MRSSTGRLAQLESDPLGLPDAIRDAKSDQWSAPVPEEGLMLYAVVADQATVIVLRLIVL